MKVGRLKIRDGIVFEKLSDYGIKELDNEYYTIQFEYEDNFYALWINKYTRIIELEVNTDIFAIPRNCI